VEAIVLYWGVWALGVRINVIALSAVAVLLISSSYQSKMMWVSLNSPNPY
jgi:hypothetical protein